MKRETAFIILIICIALMALLSSCYTPKLMYAPAKIIVEKGKLTILPVDKFKPMPDTTIEGTIIKRF